MGLVVGAHFLQRGLAFPVAADHYPFFSTHLIPRHTYIFKFQGWLECLYTCKRAYKVIDHHKSRRNCWLVFQNRSTQSWTKGLILSFSQVQDQGLQRKFQFSNIPPFHLQLRREWETYVKRSVELKRNAIVLPVHLWMQKKIPSQI